MENYEKITDVGVAPAAESLHVESISAADIHASHSHHNQTPPSFIERNSLRVAGALNLIGDLSLLAGGVKANNPYKIMGGGFYTAGAANLMYFGKLDKQFVIKDLTQRLGEFMQYSLSALPKGTELSNVMHLQSGKASAALNRRLHNQPGQNTLGLYTAGAAAMLGSGVQKYHRGEGVGELIYGMSSLGTKVISFMMPEKSDAEIAANGEKKGGVIAWFKEKPLRIYGVGSLISDASLALASFEEYKHNPQKGGYWFTALSSGAYVVSDLMMAISRKDLTNADGLLTEAEQDHIVALAAEVIAKSPRQKQPDLVTKTAHFIAHQTEIHTKESEVLALLKHHLEDVRGAQWSQRMAENDRPANAVR